MRGGGGKVIDGQPPSNAMPAPLSGIT